MGRGWVGEGWDPGGQGLPGNWEDSGFCSMQWEQTELGLKDRHAGTRGWDGPHWRHLLLPNQISLIRGRWDFYGCFYKQSNYFLQGIMPVYAVPIPSWLWYTVTPVETALQPLNTVILCVFVHYYSILCWGCNISSVATNTRIMWIIPAQFSTILVMVRFKKGKY